MAKLTDEEKAQLEALQNRANEPDDDDDFDVEWWEEDAEGRRRGGRMPWRKAKGVYGSYFPELFGDKPPADGTGEPARKERPGKVSDRYFGRGSGTGE